MKYLMGRVRVSLEPSPEERAFQQRRAAAHLRLKDAGIRPESIQKYLSRGFPTLWVRTLRQEINRLIADIKYREMA